MDKFNEWHSARLEATASSSFIGVTAEALDVIVGSLIVIPLMCVEDVALQLFAPDSPVTKFSKNIIYECMN